jgi:hypothetical protein
MVLLGLLAKLAPWNAELQPNRRDRDDVLEKLGIHGTEALTVEATRRFCFASS